TSLSPPRRRLVLPVPTGKEDELFVELEPDTVIAVDARRGDEKVIASACVLECESEAGAVSLQSGWRAVQSVEPGRGVSMSSGQPFEHALVVSPIAVVVERRPAKLPRGHYLFDADVEGMK